MKSGMDGICTRKWLALFLAWRGGGAWPPIRSNRPQAAAAAARRRVNERQIRKAGSAKKTIAMVNLISN